MARKSRKNVVVEAPVMQEKLWQAALYIRLSVEFNGKRGDSLETQRQIMEAYLALCPDIEIAEVYTDNGISGRTFERAGFQKLLADIDTGKINCVVVKDLSRLGRNAIDSGFYLEKYFPLHQVRFIAVNDQYDSETADSGSHMIVPLKNMVNEAYAADISRKVKAQQRQAMQEGQFVGGRPPYGYLKDPQDCHKLVVNPDTAPIVRQIFQWAAEGVPLNQIVLRLNESGIPTPSHYQASVGIIANKKLIGSGKWQSWPVSKLLADEVYTGDMVQGKTNHAGRKQTPVEREKWLVVRNTHEPLVSREMFAQVQLIRKQAAAKYVQKEKIPYTPNILKGRIFCGHCGKNLHRHRDQNTGNYYYYCLSNYRVGKGACKGKVFLKENSIFRAIMALVKKKAEALMGDALFLKEQNHKVVAQKKTADAEIAALQKEGEKNRKFVAGLHEAYVSGLLTRDEFLEMKAGYSQKFDYAVAHVQQLQERKSKLERQAKEYTSLAALLAKIDGNTELTAQLVDALIDRITVNGPEDIVLDFRFESGFDELMEVLHG
ncbi:recombinase TnpX [bacterium D16-76]|nr:recombinase TnpX [bacterium D16-76]